MNKNIIANSWFVWKMIISVLYGILYISRAASFGNTSGIGATILALNGLLFLSMIWGAFLLLRREKRGLTMIACSTLVNIVLSLLAVFLIPGYYLYYECCYVTLEYSGGLLMSVGPFVFSLIGLLISWAVSFMQRKA